jgi:hypothetical protein
MNGRKRGVRRRTASVLLLTALVVVITLAWTGTALADRWTDISDQQWINSYGVTATQAATVADGYADGTFKPARAVTRGQFAKMVVDGFGVAPANPASPSFRDVARGSTFYTWIEGAVAAGLISGYGDGTYKPNSNISRQQSNSILGAYLSKKELSVTGSITGKNGTYTSLDAWYSAEGTTILAHFADATSVATVHRPYTAYLVMRDVVKGSNDRLTPGTNLNRAQAVALILRVKAATFSGGNPPTITGLSPTGQVGITGGTFVTITGTNFTGATEVRFGNANATNVVVVNSTTITCLSPANNVGVYDVTVTTPAGTSSVVGTANDYSYGMPTITGLDPKGQLTTEAGTAVTITGVNLAGATQVRFGNALATNVVVVSSSTITCVAPSNNIGVYDVTVTTPVGTSSTEGTANDYSYGLPTITALDPTGQGTTAAGTLVTITGTNLTGATQVKFGTAPATNVTVVNSTTITCLSPANNLGVYEVTVTTPLGTSPTEGTANDYTYGASKFAVTMSGGTTLLSAAPKTAGTPFTVRVAAQDASGNLVPGYTGTVSLTSTAFSGTVTASITTGGYVDNVTITPTLAGTDRRITAVDSRVTTANASGDFTVLAGPLNKFGVTMSGDTTALSAADKIADKAFQVRVSAQDQWGNTVTTYTGTVALTSNAFAGTVNATVSTGGFVDGISITPTVVGTNDRFISASQGSITTANASGNFTVKSGVPDKFVVTMSGGTTALSAADKPAGTVFKVRVTAQYNNGTTVDSYTGPVTLTSNAFSGAVTATITTGGYVDNVSITPVFGGTADRYIKAVDATTTTNNASGNFTVTGGVTTFAVTTSGSDSERLEDIDPLNVGQTYYIRVTALDIYGNAVPYFTGTVALTSNAFSGTVNAVISSNGLVGDIAITPTIVGTNRYITATSGLLSTSNASGNFQVTGTDNTVRYKVTQSNQPTATLGDIDPLNAGQDYYVRVTALDQYGNVDTSNNNQVTLTSSAWAKVLPGPTAVVAHLAGGIADGVRIFPTLTGNSHKITASDGTVTTLDASGTFIVTGGVTKFAVVAVDGGTTKQLSQVSPLPAGTPQSIRVIAQNASGVTMEFYEGEITLSSTAFGKDVTLMIAAGSGYANESITPTTAGSHYITASDGSLTTNNASGSFTVSGGVTHFSITYEGGTAELSTEDQIAGQSFDIRIRAMTTGGVPFNSYNGYVTVTSTAFEGSMTVYLAGGANASTPVTPTIAGKDRIITVTDGAVTSNSAKFLVKPGQLHHFLVTMSGGTTPLSAAAKTAGTPFAVRVTAQDSCNNTIKDYKGTVDLTSDAFDGNVTATISTNGYVDTIAILPTRSGTRHITAAQHGGTVTTDDASGDFIVNPGAANHFSVTESGAAIGSPKTAGTSFLVRVTALDLYGNVATGFTGAVSLTSNAFFETVPVTITTGGMAGDISVTPKVALDNRVIYATAGGIPTNIASNSFKVDPGAAVKLLVFLPGETSAAGTTTGKTGTLNPMYKNVHFNITVWAVDAYWNKVDVTPTVAITSSNADASLPTPALLTAGAGVFSITMTNSGTITATDQATTNPLTPYTTTNINLP